ncbi:MAG: UbiA family prenyltransferase [Candidatus Hermodarchaeia archaeon]|jgi:4-hydroxybenzoate polyprenyltransferase
MRKALKSLTIVSRSEFLPANLAQLAIGVAWSINPALGLSWGLGILLILSFLVITMVAAWGAQVNTLYDYEEDSRNERKTELVQAKEHLGTKKLKGFMILEFNLSLVFLLLLIFLQGNLILLIIWVIGSFITYTYSAPPIRLKSRSWLQVVGIFFVLSILPLLFVYYTFTAVFDPLFLLFIAGHTLTVYSIIIPAEIRDYWGDKALDVETMTVRIGLVKASLTSIVMLSVGGVLTGIAYFLRLVELSPLLTISLLIMVIIYFMILRQYKRLYSLSKEFESSKESNTIAESIVSLSSKNPKWITMVTQASVLVALVFLVAKFLF